MKINEQVFDEFPVLTTNRLRLRAITAEDAAALFAMRSNGRINQFIARDNMIDPEAAARLAEKTIAAYHNRQGIGWAGMLRENKELIGTCGFNRIDYPNLRAEIGGELSVDYWGKNIALEAVGAIVQFGFDTMNLHTIEAKVAPDNRGAVFLLEKIGFKKEAHFRDCIYYDGRFLDMAVYGLVRGRKPHIFSNHFFIN